MTTTTPESVPIPAEETARRPSLRLRFAAAFLVGLVAAMAIGVGSAGSAGGSAAPAT